MGIFKQVKDMRSMVAEAPGLISQANGLTANARALVDQQNAIAGAVSAPGLDDGLHRAPVAGVSFEQYVAISRESATVGHDVELTRRIAIREGVSAENWTLAIAGWNARIQSDPALAHRFSSSYGGR